MNLADQLLARSYRRTLFFHLYVDIVYLIPSLNLIENYVLTCTIKNVMGNEINWIMVI